MQILSEYALKYAAYTFTCCLCSTVL